MVFHSSNTRPARAARARVALRAALAVVLAGALALQPVGVALAQSPTARVPSMAEPTPMFTLREPSRLPDLGDESQTLATPAQERKMGETVVRQIRGSGAYLDDPEVNDYLNDLGQRLVAAVPDSRTEFEFFAVNDPQINAFALPGGFVGVNTGLILLTQTESELASVLAHEITHVTQHHLTRAVAGQQRSLLYSLAALAVALAASRGSGASGGQAASAAIASAQALAIQSQINYTREHEYEADRIGFQRLDAAGFDDTAMATVMERLQKQTRFAESGNTPSYLRTHPVTFERIAEAQSRAASKPYRQVPDSLDFQMVRGLLRSYTGTPKEAIDFFRASLKDRKYNSEVATRYGLVASLLRAQDLTTARRELAALEKIAPAHPMIDAMAGHVLMESGDLEGAIDRFHTALAKYPNKLQLVYDYPEALIKAGRPREASAFIERELQRFPGNGPLHRLAARAYADLGRNMQEHLHQGEFYAWQGDLKGAITQLELAAKAKDGDFYTNSMVDTRLRELRRDVEEERKLARNG